MGISKEQIRRDAGSKDEQQRQRNTGLGVLGYREPTLYSYTLAALAKNKWNVYAFFFTAVDKSSIQRVYCAIAYGENLYVPAATCRYVAILSRRSGLL